MIGVSAEYKKHTRIFSYICIIIFSAVIFTVSFLSVNSADDYWYSQFMSGTMENYFAQMKIHYQTFNGRMIVHFFAQLILHFPHFGFAFASVIFCLLTPLISCKLFSADREKTVFSVVIFEAFIILIPRGILINAYLWVSAFCNYALPVLFTVIALYLIFRVIRSDRKNNICRVFAVFLAFICGASTEQSGLCIVAFCLLLYLFSIIITKKNIIFTMLLCVFSIAGVATIFLSPATFVRMINETTGALTQTTFFKSLLLSVRAQVSFFAQHFFLLAVISVFFVITAYRIYSVKKIWYLSVAIAVFPVWLIFGMLSNIKILSEICYLLLLMSFAVPIVYFFKSRMYERLGITFIAVLSILVMLFTQSNGSRTFLPFCIYVYLLCALSLAELFSLQKIGRTYALFAVSVGLSAFAFVTALPHYIYNFKLDNSNIQSIKQTEKNVTPSVNVDYDMDYTYHKFFNDYEFYKRYKEANAIPENQVLRLVSDKYPSIKIDDYVCTSPAFKSDAGAYYLPFFDIIEKLGGNITNNANDATAVISFGGRIYKYHYADKKFTWNDVKGNPHIYYSDYLHQNYKLAFDTDTFSDVFGIEVSYEKDGDRIKVINIEYK